MNEVAVGDGACSEGRGRHNNVIIKILLKKWAAGVYLLLAVYKFKFIIMINKIRKLDRATRAELNGKLLLLPLPLPLRRSPAAIASFGRTDPRKKNYMNKKQPANA